MDVSFYNFACITKKGYWPKVVSVRMRSRLMDWGDSGGFPLAWKFTLTDAMVEDVGW